MARGVAWAVAIRWSIRLIGLVSTVILARLLTPDDYGVVIQAMLVVGLIEVFSETGQSSALLRYPEPTREHYDSAFTVSILFSLALGSVVVASAPLAGWLFNEPRVEPVIMFLSLRVYVRGFENVATVSFRSERKFAKDFRYVVYRKLFSFTATLIAALVLRNYWALAIGIVFGEIASIVSSYVMHPYRPGLSLRKARELWSVSGWLLMGSVANYVQETGDGFVAGSVANTDALGRYQVAADIASLPTAEIVAPLGRALFPIYSQLANAPESLKASYLKVLSLITLFCLSSATGIALAAEPMIVVVLGEQWRSAWIYLPWMAFNSSALALTTSVLLVLQATGHARRYASFAWIRALLTIAAMTAVGLITRDLIDLAAARLAVTLCLAPFVFASLSHAIPFSVGDLWSSFWRPALASIVMALGLLALKDAFSAASPAIDLAALVSSGILLFAGAEWVLWRLAGRPDGAERIILDWLSARLGRFAPS